MFTKEERVSIRELIQSGMIMRYNPHETKMYVEKNLNLKISLPEIFRIKNLIKKEARSWITELENRDAFIHQYQQSIKALEANQRELWKCYHNPNATVKDKILAQKELARITIAITQLYDLVPSFSQLPNQIVTLPQLQAEQPTTTTETEGTEQNPETEDPNAVF